MVKVATRGQSPKGQLKEPLVAFVTRVATVREKNVENEIFSRSGKS